MPALAVTWRGPEVVAEGDFGVLDAEKLVVMPGAPGAVPAGTDDAGGGTGVPVVIGHVVTETIGIVTVPGVVTG